MLENCVLVSVHSRPTTESSCITGGRPGQGHPGAEDEGVDLPVDEGVEIGLLTAAVIVRVTGQHQVVAGVEAPLGGLGQLSVEGLRWLGVRKPMDRVLPPRNALAMALGR